MGPPTGSTVQRELDRAGCWRRVLVALTDQLGSVAAVTNRHGSILENIAYSPYGTKSTSAGSSSAKLMGFTGSYRSSTGLVYEQARWHDRAPDSSSQWIQWSTSPKSRTRTSLTTRSTMWTQQAWKDRRRHLYGSSSKRRGVSSLSTLELTSSVRPSVAGSWFGSGAGCRPQQSGTREAIRAAIDHVGGYRYAR